MPSHPAWKPTNEPRPEDGSRRRRGSGTSTRFAVRANPVTGRFQVGDHFFASHEVESVLGYCRRAVGVEPVVEREVDQLVGRPGHFYPAVDCAVDRMGDGPKRVAASPFAPGRNTRVARVEGEAAAAGQVTSDVAQRGGDFLVGQQELKDMARHYGQIEAARQREPDRVGLDPIHPATIAAFPGDPQHLRCRVDPSDREPATGIFDGKQPRSAADVEGGAIVAPGEREEKLKCRVPAG